MGDGLKDLEPAIDAIGSICGRVVDNFQHNVEHRLPMSEQFRGVEEFVATVEAIGRELKRGDFVFRYVEEDDFGAPQNAFVICSFCPRPYDFDPQAVPIGQ